MRSRILSFCAFAVALPGLLHTLVLAATWQGTFPSGSDQHRVVIQIAKKQDGGWTAPECDVEFLHDGARVDSLILNGSRLRLTISGGAFTYEGQVNSDSTSISWHMDLQRPVRSPGTGM